MYSYKLRHFPDLDPPASKKAERQKLQNDINEFLANGGHIEQLGNASGVVFVPRKNREELLSELRRKSWNKRNQKNAVE